VSASTPRIRLLSIAFGAAVLASGCREAPPARPLAARVAEITEVNTADAFVDSIAVTRDASRVATGQRNGSIRVWTPAGGSEPATFGPTRPRQAIIDLAFAPSGELLASLGRSGEGALRLWRPDASAWVQIASVPLGRCLALRFNGAGDRLAVMCEREVVVVDVATNLATGLITNPHREVMTAFDLAASGARLVTAGHEGDVMVWDAVTATSIRQFSVSRSRRPYAPPPGMPPPEVWAVVVALSPDGSRVAAVTIEGTVYAWDVATGAELLADAHPEAAGPPTGSLRFTTDGRLLAPTGDRLGMRVFDLTRKSTRVAAAGAKAYHVVSITDDATGFAAVTSAMESGKLIYDVELWRMEPASGS
jgi:WD40 repeat protein